MKTTPTRYAIAATLSLLASVVAAEPWVDKDEYGQAIYFAFTSPPRIERFYMDSGVFDPAPIALASAPSAVAVDASGIYVAYGQIVYHLDLNGANQTHRLNSPGAIQSLLLMGNYLLVHHTGDQFISADKTTGTILDIEDFWYTMQGLSIDTATKRVYGSFINGSPTDIVYFSVNGDGTFGAQLDSPFHGELRTGLGTFTSATTGFVLDTSGTAYTSSLQLAGSVAGTFLDAAFSGTQTVLARGNHIMKFDSQFRETGVYTPPHAPAGVAVNGGVVFSFYAQAAGAGVGVDGVFLTAIEPTPPADVIDPTGLLYYPDKIVRDSGGLIYLLDAFDRMVFVWSAAVQDYVNVIPLTGSPDYMEYVSAHDALYFGFVSGKITAVDLGGPQRDVSFANTPNRLMGLGGADNWVFAANGNDASPGRFNYIHDATGVMTDGSATSAVYSDEYIWDQSLRRMYYLQDGYSPNDLNYAEINPDGTFGAFRDSPYHGDFSFSHPIRVSPAGDRILIGTGRIFDSAMTVVNTLPESLFDAAWLNGVLYTLHDDGAGNSRVQRWDGTNYAPGASAVEFGTPLALIAVPEGLVVITQYLGSPTFTLLDAALVAIPANGNGGGGGACFIATAAYGTPLARELDALRAFRDSALLRTAAGAAFTDAYYRISPPLARGIAADRSLQVIARVAISIALPGLRTEGISLGALAVVLVGLGGTMTVRRVRFTRTFRS